MRRFVLIKLLVAAAAAPVIAHAAALFTIGPDANPLFPVPRVLNQLPTSAPVTASSLGSLGDGSIGFNGGLAYNTGDTRLYSIGNDSLGDSTLYSTTTLGTSLTSIAGIGTGFNGGLAYHAGNGLLYAIGNDFLGNSTLYSMTALGASLTPIAAIGTGFYGGLTYNADDDLLYAVAGDSLGVMRSVVAIDPVTASTTPLFDLGDGSLGFNGGLAYDDAADLFYVIGNDSSVNSTLYSFTLGGGGAGLAPIGASFGQGFLNVGLALAPAVTPAPEPPPFALIALAALLALASMRLHAPHPASRPSS